MPQSLWVRVPQFALECHLGVVETKQHLRRKCDQEWTKQLRVCKVMSWLSAGCDFFQPAITHSDARRAATDLLGPMDVFIVVGQDSCALKEKRLKMFVSSICVNISSYRCYESYFVFVEKLCFDVIWVRLIRATVWLNILYTYLAS